MAGRSLRLPMRAVLLLPFAAVLMTSMAVITSINSRNAEAYAKRIAIEMAGRTSEGVSVYLNGFMRQPIQVVESMADAVNNGMVNPASDITMARFLYELRGNFPGVPYVSYAFLDHAFIGIGKSSNDDTLPDVLETRPAGNSTTLFQYALLAGGSRGALQSRDSFGSFLNEDWFAAPLKAGRMVWTPIYNWDDAPEVMAISLGKPISFQGRPIGIAGTDVLLASLSRHLQSLQLSPQSVIYITEDTGLLVASSDHRLPFDIKQGKGQRRAALMDPNAAVRSSAALLIRRFNGFDRIDRPYTLRLPLQQEPHLIRVVPWRDPLGLHWIITLVVPESEFTGFVSQQRRDTALLCLGAMGLAGLLGWRLVTLLIKPIESVALASQQLAEWGRAPQLRPGRLIEVNRLSKAFSAMARRLERLLAELELRRASAEEEVAQRTAELQQVHRRLQQEEAMAASIQRDLLVQEARLDGLADDLEVGALMVASRAVGGDLYDCIALDDELLLFCVGDVSGKGMPAALLMSTCLSLLRAYCEALDSPSAIMRRINRRLAYHNASCDFTTLVIGVINRGTGELRYCNAGHNPMLLRRAGGGSEAVRDVHGPALGIREDVVYGEGRLFLQPEDLLLAYSDGASEMFDPQGRRFGLQRLISSLDQSATPQSLPASAVVRSVLAALRRHAGSEPPHDDITLLALRRRILRPEPVMTA
jgi:hypothetical protein